jgi:uncharacterized membrane-anchored protein YhcB (DUF1043 family)
MWIVLGYVICLVVGLLIAGIPLLLKLRKHESVNDHIRQLNIEEEKKNQELIIRKEELQKQFDEIAEQVKKTSQMADEAAEAYAKAALDKATASIETSLEELGRQYRQAEQDYDDEYCKLMEDLVHDMNDTIELKRKLISELEIERDGLARSVAATIQARVREKEVKEQLDFYCLKIDPADRGDITMLNQVKSRLSKPRILSMLIWQTYYQKPMTQLCNDVLGTSVVTGIYKITNQTTDQVYIGQARDMASRWKEHAKCGLDIDRPAGNKLYLAMMEDGIENFSWELLEKCTPQELNEKERQYIELYQALEYGYNSNKGVSK